MGCIHADGGTPNHTCNRCEADERRPATVVVRPELRVDLLHACAWLADLRDEEARAAEAGAINIRNKRKVIAGCYPVAVPLYLIADDLKASNKDILLAATELVKLGHLAGNPDVRLVIADSVQITDAGRQWFARYRASSQRAVPTPAVRGDREGDKDNG